jgi:hypothetical protein
MVVKIILSDEYSDLKLLVIKETKNFVYLYAA